MSEGKLSEARRAALAKAQGGRRKAARAKRRRLVPPEGFRSVEHFLDSAKERANRRAGGQAELARYLATSDKSVSRWLRREQYPQQATLEAMGRWYLGAR